MLDDSVKINSEDFKYLTPSPLADREFVVLPGDTTRICPKCQSVRVRIYKRKGPLSRSQCQNPIVPPRLSGKKHWWTHWPFGIILESRGPWFDCSGFVWCHKCPDAEIISVKELSVSRQFPLIRRMLFWFEENLFTHRFRMRMVWWGQVIREVAIRSIC